MSLHSFDQTRSAVALAVARLTLCGALLGCEAPPCQVQGPAQHSLQVTVGVGERGVFQMVRDGETLRLQRGCQGSQHIFTSLRIQPASAGPLQVSVTVSRQADGVVVSAPLSLRLPAEPSDDPHAVQLTGLTPVIEAPREVVGHEVLIRAEVTSSDGSHGEDQLVGTVEWGLDSCGGHG